MTNDKPLRATAETVEEETINAYRVQKLATGSIRIQSGGRVITAPTYYEALERYAAWGREDVEESPEHLRPDKRASIYDGVIPLLGFDSSGFTPEEILDDVTGHPLEVVLDDLAQNSDHGGLCYCYECINEADQEPVEEHHDG